MNIIDHGLSHASTLFLIDFVINYLDVQKLVYLFQSNMDWTLEQVYAFIIKTRTAKDLFGHFIRHFERYNKHANDDDIEKNVKWLSAYIKQINYVCFLALSF
jgi:hypothetical protein